MAFRITRRVRTTGLATVLIAAAVTVPTVASAQPGGGSASSPRPTIQSVQKQLGGLALRNDQLVEKYNQANNTYLAARVAAAKATKAYQAAQHRLSVAQNLLAQSAAAQYEGGTFSATGALLSSDSGSSYLDQLDTLSMLSQHNAQVVSSFTVLQTQAEQADATAHRLYADAKGKRAAVLQQRTVTRNQIEKYKQLLGSLNAQQRAMWAARNGANVSAGAASQLTSLSMHAASVQARRAVHFALDQVGKPYVFGASGPDSYDCSGLTMRSWQEGGVSLPHSAADQYNYGTHVSYDQLLPGDLVFFYQPIGHVAIYIGDGMMVSAPQPGENVQVVSLQDFANDYTGATRLVG
ncbi:MAG: NlpC/P60 family protein [Jatrophihabitantaceae bacterium]